MQNKKLIKAVWSSNLTVDQAEEIDHPLKRILNNDSNPKMQRDISLGLLAKNKSLATFDTNTTPGNQDSIIDRDTL